MSALGAAPFGFCGARKKPSNIDRSFYLQKHFKKKLPKSAAYWAAFLNR
jgi:hypothetical protein